MREKQLPNAWNISDKSHQEDLVLENGFWLPQVDK